MRNSTDRRIRAYFDQAAPAYAAEIAPAFGRLNEALTVLAEPLPGQRVLDLGSGPGLLSAVLRGHGVASFPLDLSRAMLQAAPAHLPRVQADAHSLPFPRGSFDLVLAAFTLNSTDPPQALREAWRVTRAGGRFLAHEWGEEDELSELISDAVAGYAVEAPPAALAALRAGADAPLPWDDLEDIDHLGRLSQSVGFQLLDCEARQLAVPFASVEAFIRFKFAWPLRSAELAAMPAAMRRLCLSEIEEGLARFTGEKGRLIWRPSVVQLACRKPG